MTHGLVLSLFPGIDVLGMGFELEGWCVVRGPDVLWGGNIRTFHPPRGRFEGVIGGPPCQAFSQLRHIVEANKYQTAPNLIPEYERVVEEAAPDWFVMENVPRAPEPCVAGYMVNSFVLDNRWLGEAQQRKRRFSFGTADGRRLHIAGATFESLEFALGANCSAGHIPKIGGSGKVKKHRAQPRRSIEELAELQGLPRETLASAPFTAAGKAQVIGNAVPLPMARAVAKAVGKALERAA